jgi:hypothetical protein
MISTLIVSGWLTIQNMLTKANPPKGGDANSPAQWAPSQDSELTACMNHLSRSGVTAAQQPVLRNANYHESRRVHRVVFLSHARTCHDIAFRLSSFNSKGIIMNINRYLRRKTIVALTALLVSAGVQPALAASEKSLAVIGVDFPDCTAATVTSSKAISNVVIALEGGGFQKFEAGVDFNEEMTVLTLSMSTGFDDTIETLYVKSGSNKTKVMGLPGKVGDAFPCSAEE